MENIISLIYEPCDTQNANAVPVSSLVELIKPYMVNNPNELEELKSQLDPEHTDPLISKEYFQEVTSKWIASMQMDDTIQDLTASSSINMNNSLTNNLNLEEEVKSLRHQLSQTTMELDLAKQELLTSEEHIESLTAQLKSNKAQNTNFQQTRTDLEEFIKLSEHKAEISVLENKCQHLKKLLAIAEKKEQACAEKMAQFDNENANLKLQLETHKKQIKEHRRSLNNLRDNIDQKETETKLLMETIEQLKSDLGEHEELVEFYKNENKFLKQKTRNLESSQFNTPKLLRQLANPISPTLGTPLRTSSPLRSTDSSYDCSLTPIPVLRSPHQTLKEELAEINSGKEEMFKVVVKNQEELKHELWNSLKKVSLENETLKREAIREHKKDLDALVSRLAKTEKNLKQAIDADRSARKNFIAIYNSLFVVNQSLRKKLLRERCRPRPEMVDKCCGGDYAISVDPVAPSQGTNFAKQQLKIDRLIEKVERLQEESSKERSINIKLTQKLRGEKEENVMLQGELQELRRTEQRLRAELENVRKREVGLGAEVDNLQRQQNTMMSSIRHENEFLIEQQRKMFEEAAKQNENILQLMGIEQELRKHLAERNNEIIFLRNQLGLLNEKLLENLSETDNERKLLKSQIDLLNKKLPERDNEIKVLTSQIDKLNEKLERFVVETMELLKFDEEFVESVRYPNYEDDALTSLENNVAVVTDFLKIVSNKYLQFLIGIGLVDPIDGITEFSDMSSDELFTTCSSESFEFSPEVDLVFDDSECFLKNLDLLQLNSMCFTDKEMQDCSATLFLSTALDVATLKKQNASEKEKFNELVLKFFSYLDSSIDLFTGLGTRKFRNQRSVISSLKTLKDIGEDVLKSAMRCGVLVYEEKMSCHWNNVLKYIDTLSQEKKGSKDELKETIQNPINTAPSRSCFCTISLKSFVYFCFMLLSVFIMLFLYVDQQCPKNGKYICPLEWLLSLVVTKTYKLSV